MKNNYSICKKCKKNTFQGSNYCLECAPKHHDDGLGGLSVS